MAARAAPIAVTLSAVAGFARLPWFWWNSAMESLIAAFARMMPQTTSLSSVAIAVPYIAGMRVKASRSSLMRTCRVTANDAPVSLDTVALAPFGQSAALELAALVHLHELRGFAELDTVHRLEVGREHLPAEGDVGARIGIVGLPQRLARHGGENLRKVRGGMESAGGDLVARHAPDIDARA